MNQVWTYNMEDYDPLTLQMTEAKEVNLLGVKIVKQMSYSRYAGIMKSLKTIIFCF